MPRKASEWRFTLAVAETDPQANEIVTKVLTELGVVPTEQLVVGPATAIGRFRCVTKVRRQGVSDRSIARDILMADVKRTLEQDGQRVTRWRKGDRPSDGAGESLYFKLAHKLGDAFGIDLPGDLPRAAGRAAGIRYGEMTPAMAAWQATALRQVRRTRIVAALSASFRKAWEARRSRRTIR